jgi:hypothetical protein
VSYDDLPGSYYDVVAGGARIWAWNFDHLTMLVDLLDGQRVDGHVYESLATYAHGEWKARKHRSRLAKALRKRWLDRDVATLTVPIRPNQFT